MTEARIDVVIGTAQAQAGAQNIQRAVNDVKAGVLGLTAAVATAGVVIERMWRAAKQGAEFEQTWTRLDRQMGNFHSRAQLIVGDLQQISQQTLSIDRAAALASRGLAAGLNPDQLRTFTEAADALGDVLGTDLPSAFEQIVQASSSGRTQILASIGVYVDLEEEVKRLAVSTGRTTEQITKQERAMLTANAITKQAGDAIGRLSDGALSDAKKLEQVEARWRNLWLTMEQGAKSAVIGTLDALATLRKAIDDNNPFRKAMEVVERLQPGSPTNPKTQEIFGRAIVQNAQGALGRAPIGPTEPVKGLPPSLLAKQLDAERDRQGKALQDDLELVKMGFDGLSRLYDLDAQRQMLTQEDLVQMKGVLRLRDLDAQGETLNRQLELEKSFHDRRVRIGFESTEERIDEDERYRSKVFDLNQAVRKVEAETAAASQQNEAERDVARLAAESRRGQRLVDAARSEFEIRETMRQRDFDAQQAYYQGDLEMAQARFASDQEIAQKERHLLREQLAFKLRITREELDQILLLRQTGNTDLANRRLASQGDPLLPQGARQGLLESGTAKDMLLAERANGDFFAGWRRGLQQYARDRDSAFGMSQDMARRTAQGMEQGFQQFFFAPMDKHFRGYEDILDGLLNMTKQIVSQIAAQLMTVGIIQPLVGGLTSSLSSTTGLGSSLFSGVGGRDVRGVDVMKMRFASGGSFTVGGSGGTDSQPIGFMATPGELVTVTPPGKSGFGVQVPISINIMNQMPGAEVSAARRSMPGGGQEISVLITKRMNEAVSSGELDRAMRSRFGLTPGEH